MFVIQLGNPARRFLKSCESQIYERIMTRIRLLAEDPFPQEVVRVVGRKEKIFRVRVGDYRIQYMVIYKENILLITDVDKRPRAY